MGSTDHSIILGFCLAHFVLHFDLVIRRFFWHYASGSCYDSRLYYCHSQGIITGALSETLFEVGGLYYIPGIICSFPSIISRSLHTRLYWNANVVFKWDRIGNCNSTLVTHCVFLILVKYIVSLCFKFWWLVLVCHINVIHSGGCNAVPLSRFIWFTKTLTLTLTLMCWLTCYLEIVCSRFTTWVPWTP